MTSTRQVVAAGQRCCSRLARPPAGADGRSRRQNLTEAARETLGKLDVILTDNAKPLNTAVTGLPHSPTCWDATPSHRRRSRG